MQAQQAGRRVAAAAILALAAGPVTADVEFLGGFRGVSAHMTGGADDHDSAPGLGYWAGTAMSLAPGPAHASLTSSQISTVDSAGIVASGALTYARVMSDFTSGTARGEIDYFFSVDEPTAYTIDGDLREGSAGVIRLVGSGGPLHSGSFLHVSGVLEPGLYEFTSTVELGAPQVGPGTANWQVAFVVPAPPVAGVLIAAGLFAAKRRRSDVDGP